ncbi:HK97 gp10 family phage protein [Micromonospora sp. WMMD1120]|uniref:HK97 gp10 family phage protein n=1 Tax=Micromonospora sp. WMMD1120 TaxID=3016106 RepID=UPI0024162A2B|nr:HK97 gp10 family phage protein [Micromonospora sp. WMMD1120]MDG4809943.1 HK97 gp10 family phage protein [Micromonospora sp. WMMD1120]
MTEPIRIEGLNEFNRALKKLDADAPKGLRLAHNEAAQIVVDAARPMMPSRTGRARAAVKARSTRTATRVSAGSARAPYVPWLDYGGEGRVKGRPAHREFRKGGRYVYPAFHAKRDDVQGALAGALLKVVSDAGLEVD